MVDYIERGAAIATAISGLVRYDEGERWIRVKEVRESLRDAPTADVAPIVHAHWEMKPDKYAWYEKTPVCSVCGFTTKRQENYCGNCGAKMYEDVMKLVWLN